MARMYPLFSSSKGNATYIGNRTEGILVDAGVSLRRLEQAFLRAELSISAVRGIFITHDHSDHIKGLAMLTKRYGIPVYGQPVTLQRLREKDAVQPDTACIPIGDGVTVAGMEVVAFETSHDTAQSCGYRVTMADGTACGICTDLGYVSDSVAAALLGCRLVLLEANYDETMLRNGTYPAELKARIRSNFGHLSNTQCGEFAAELVEHGTRYLVLGHLSEHNNTPAHAERAVESALGQFRRGVDYLLSVAAPETDGRMIVF